MDSSLQIIVFNCRSIYTKLSEFKLYLYRKKPHCVCLTETWLIPDKLPTFVNYQCFWKHRQNGRGGGIGMLIRSDVPVLPTNFTTYDDILETQKQTIVLDSSVFEIINIYNPIGSTNYETLKKYFDQLGRKGIVVGDFNAHHGLWSLPGVAANIAGKAIAQILQSSPNIGLATPPGLNTYVNPGTGTGSVLDLSFVTSNLLSDITITLGPCLSSDHLPVEHEIGVKPCLQPFRFRKRYKLNSIDWQSWGQGLADIQWEPDSTLNEANTRLVENLKTSTYELKQTSGQYNPKYNKDWWTDTCSKLVALRRQAKHRFRKHPTEFNLRLLRIAENNAKDEIKAAKERSWQSFASSITSFTTTGQVWSKVQKIRNKFKPKIAIIDHRNKLYTVPEEKCEVLVQYFEEKFTSGFNPDNLNNMVMSVQNAILDPTDKPYNRLFTNSELKIGIQMLRNTSPGIDGIENLFLKNLPLKYMEYILQLFNESWQLESLPDQWKVALTVPICKLGKPSSQLSSYRPISMLSCVGKLLERLVKTRLEWYIERNLLLSSSQAGFRKCRSTRDQITCVEDEIRSALSDTKCCVAVFLDLAGAFDAVDHNSVLFKMSRMGVTGTMLGWLQGYLENRKFRIIFEGAESNEKVMHSGVPQGGILSPLLFNILLHDIPVADGVHCSIFADDIALFTSDFDPIVAVTRMQTSLNMLHHWTTQWGQSLNAAKTKAMYFAKFPVVPSDLYLGGENLEYVAQYKFLGFMFDSPKLTWKLHINKLKASCAGGVALLKSVAHNHWGSDRNTLLLLYKSLVRSRLDYCSHIYDTASNSLTSSLEAIQNQCLRICIGSRQTTPIVSLLAEAHVPPLAMRRTFLACKYYSRLMEQPSATPVVVRLKMNRHVRGNKGGYFQSCLNFFGEWNLPKPSANHRLACSPLPPWSSLDDNVFCDFHGASVESLSPLMAQQLFKELKSDRFPTFIPIFTDGSKTDTGIGAAYAIPTKTISNSFSLENEVSVLTSEIYAIYRAALHVKCEGGENRYVIYSDSKSAIMLLSSTRPASYCYYIFMVQAIIIQMNGNLSIQWIPGHKGIAGNETADRLARQGSEGAGLRTTVCLPSEDFANICKHKLHIVWKRHWEQTVIHDRKGTALYAVKNDLKFWPWTSHTERVVETGVARLRLGHVGLAQHLHRFRMADTPLCECGEVENVSHFLLDCPEYTHSRRVLQASLSMLQITEPLSLLMLLGGSDRPAKIQFKILSHLAIYLRETGKLYQL